MKIQWHTKKTEISNQIRLMVSTLKCIKFSPRKKARWIISFWQNKSNSRCLQKQLLVLNLKQYTHSKISKTGESVIYLLRFAARLPCPFLGGPLPRRFNISSFDKRLHRTRNKCKISGKRFQIFWLCRKAHPSQILAAQFLHWHNLALLECTWCKTAKPNELIGETINNTSPNLNIEEVFTLTKK